MSWLTHDRSKGDGDYEICNDFILDDWLRSKIKATEDELAQEKSCVSHLIGLDGGSCAIRGAPDTTVSFCNRQTHISCLCMKVTCIQHFVPEMSTFSDK
jgi:hypothetical protein